MHVVKFFQQNKMELLSKLSEQGVIALLLAISIMGNIWFVRLVLEMAEKRLIDVKEHRDQTLKTLESIKSTVDTILLGVVKDGH